MKKAISILHVLRLATLLLSAGFIINCSRGHQQTKVIQQSASSLFSNSGFENGLKGYDLFDAGGGSATVTGQAAYSGANGLRLYKMAIEPSLESFPTLDSNKVYMLSFWARVVTFAPDGAADPDPIMKVSTGFWNRQIGASSEYIPETVNRIRVQSTTWQKFEYAIEPNYRSGYVWLLNINFSSSADTNNVVDIDDLVIEEIEVQ